MSPLADMGKRTADTEMHIDSAGVSAKEAVEKRSQSYAWTDWTLFEDGDSQELMIRVVELGNTTSTRVGNSQGIATE